jgi:hypothetical protein
MFVLVEEAPESVTSTDVEAVGSVRFGDRFGERPVPWEVPGSGC